jgi:methylated-DNA-[protein]-cysteine S-methyltransferase
MNIEQRLLDAAAAIKTEPVRLESDELADVAYATVDSPVGELLVAATRRGLVRIVFLDHLDRDEVLAQLADRLSPRVIEAPRRVDEVRRQLDDYLAGKRTEFELPLDWALVGPFGRRVLRRTARIPYGQVATYGQVARDIRSPGAARAAGNALGRNPIPIIVPCHRVVPGTGGVGGYGGGAARKEFLLSLERA